MSTHNDEMFKRNTASQLFAYIHAIERGEEYTGFLGEEAKVVIQQSTDLADLKEEAEAINFLDNTLFG